MGWPMAITASRWWRRVREEIQELLHSVNVLVARLYSLEQSRRQLLANLVHELGRPLGALRSAIQALSRGAAQDPQLLDELAMGMDGEAARLQNIVEDLAHLHDQVLGTLELNCEPTVLQDWLPGVLVPWQEAAHGKTLEWKTEIPADLPAVEIDQMRFAQVIGNLASNAVKYTPAGGSVTVDRRAGRRAGLAAVLGQRARHHTAGAGENLRPILSWQPRESASSKGWGWG